MAHRVISLRYRPQNFDELTGQNHVVLSLKGAITSGRIGHAFLFAGPRGVGKTTTARILAKSLNCNEGPTITPCQKCPPCHEITLSRSIDVVEIDGASNRGIDEIRDLREGVKYAPLQGRYKIYIIDEVHMLTQEAFNALLKTLEEPPPKVIFIFATTNPVKVPSTILSRCQRFVFKRLSIKEITSRLQDIADKETIAITKNALHYIAVRADGSVRDGESILEQLTSFVEGEITEDDVFKLIGFLGSDFYYRLLGTVLTKDLGAVISSLNKEIEDGADPLEIYRGFTSYLRSALLLRTNVSHDFIELDREEIEQLETVQLSEKDIIQMLELCLRFEEMIKRSANVRIAIELLFSQLVLHLTKSSPPMNNQGSTPKNKSTGVKEELVINLQKSSPKLAGIIHDAEIEQQGDMITIFVNSEFSRKQLENAQKKVTSVLKEVLHGDCTVQVQVRQKKEEENNLAQRLKVMFDGEEVR